MKVKMNTQTYIICMNKIMNVTVLTDHIVHSKTITAKRTRFESKMNSPEIETWVWLIFGLQTFQVKSSADSDVTNTETVWNKRKSNLSIVQRISHWRLHYCGMPSLMYVYHSHSATSR